MRYAIRTIGMLAVLSASAACARGPASAANADAARDRSAINALRSAYTSAVNASDAARVSTFFTDDAVRAESNRPALAGRDAIVAYEREVMTAFERVIARKPAEVEVAGQWAFDRGEYIVHLKARKSGEELAPDEGQYLVVLRRQSDNSWKIAREITSSMLAPRSESRSPETNTAPPPVNRRKPLARP